MKAYCIDTSGLSNPLEHMPEDIHKRLWSKISNIIHAGKLAATTEIYDELTHLPGPIGEFLKASKGAVQLEVGDAAWDGATYLGHAARMQIDHAPYISENNGNRKNTVCLNDLSIVALGRSLRLPVICSEVPVGPGGKWRKIPNVCQIESVEHITFNDFLRREGIVL